MKSSIDMHPVDRTDASCSAAPESSVVTTAFGSEQFCTVTVFTAFGERIAGANPAASTRYGYAGAWGYQTHADFPFLHVGHRYYDPSTGRFIQRDPIGIRGGKNLFQYASAIPTVGIDPEGEWVWFPLVVGVIMFIDILASPAEAPSPDDDYDAIKRRRQEFDNEAMKDIAMKFIPYGALCSAVLRQAGKAGSQAMKTARQVDRAIRPNNPDPFVSPFPPMPKGPFIGGGKVYE